MEKKYAIQKEDCKNLIKGVCPRCGGELTPIETVDNSDNPTYWGGCEPCGHFDWGVDSMVFKIAEHMVVKENHIQYTHMELPTERSDEAYKKYWIGSQTSGTCRIVSRVLALYNELNTPVEQ